MGLILVGSKLSTSNKKGKAEQKEAKQEKTQRTDQEIIPKNKVPLQSEQILNEDDNPRDK